LLVSGKNNPFIYGRLAGPFIIIFLSFLILSCSSTRHLPEDEYLLNRNRIENTNRQIDNNEIEGYIRPKPNKRVLGVKFYLGIYNLAGAKDNWLNRWLKKIGEEPVIWNEFDVEKNNERVRLYLRNKGYYHADVEDTTRFNKRKANVKYEINPGEPYIIDRISWDFRDSTIRNLVLSDTVNTVLKKGLLFDSDIIQEERTRIETHLKTLGYYNFSKELINFVADTIEEDLKVNLTVIIDEYQLKKKGDFYIKHIPNRKYRIDTVFILSDFNQKDALVDYQEYLKSLTKSVFNKYSFLYHDRLKINPDVITQCVYIVPGKLYDINDVGETYQHLSSLRIFKTVNIFFDEEDPDNEYLQADYPLNCYIQLTPATLQAYSFELEGTNSSGNFGAAGNISYQHRNLFGGAENLNIRLKGSVEFLRKINTSNAQNPRGAGFVYEAGIDARLTLPQFLLPYKAENFIRKYNPKTRISLAFNQQRRPDYTRRLSNAGFGYTWSNFPYISHIINPVDINYVKMLQRDSSFIEEIKNTYLEHSYEDRLITSTNYSFIFNNQDIKKLSSYSYFRLNAEQAGFLLSGGYNFFGTPIESGHFEGVAWPYGNSVAIPFEKQYFTGGANGIRAWPVRNLGPGTYLDTISIYPNATADIKLEGNVEYRFKLFWILEGALFVDAGNIWAINEDDNRHGAVFKWNSFYKQIAIGTGFGIRMDFSFFIFRFDLGVKARDPSIPAELGGPRWVIFNRPPGDQYNFGYFTTFHLAIGYPF
jgi:outer membrane protein assembly factor BamA